MDTQLPPVDYLNSAGRAMVNACVLGTPRDCDIEDMEKSKAVREFVCNIPKELIQFYNLMGELYIYSGMHQMHQLRPSSSEGGACEFDYIHDLAEIISAHRNIIEQSYEQIRELPIREDIKQDYASIITLLYLAERYPSRETINLLTSFYVGLQMDIYTKTRIEAIGKMLSRQ
jgi:hypothetical protein